jgi:hypothetical protein
MSEISDDYHRGIIPFDLMLQQVAVCCRERPHLVVSDAIPWRCQYGLSFDVLMKFGQRTEGFLQFGPFDKISYPTRIQLIPM